MIFVDTNVFMYAIGAAHPNRSAARAMLEGGAQHPTGLFTSAEVLQELLHVYHRRGELERFGLATALVDSCVREVWPVTAEDVRLAGELAADHGDLEARDLLHLATCHRRGASGIETFDAALEAAFHRRAEG